MGFVANIHEVPLNVDMLTPLLATTREIYEHQTSPRGRDGCKNCKLLNDVIDIGKA